MKAVEVNNISKSYNTKDPVSALRAVSFDVNRGELFGLIGPDGAGKTSLFRIVATLLLADEGSVTVDGYDVVKDYKSIRKRLGYMPGRFSLYQDLTVEENIHFFAAVFQTSIEANYGLIKDIYSQIEPFRNRRAGKLSGGMKQKLALCCALIHRPSVLLLDEPTTGVDAVSRKEFWEMLKSLKSQGITIIVSTPYMDEASKCDRIALMQQGSIMSMNTPGAIIAAFDKPLLAIRSENMLRLLKDVKALSQVHDVYPFGEYHHVVLKHRDHLRDFDDELHRSAPGAQIKSIVPVIEDCFMALMKR